MNKLTILILALFLCSCEGDGYGGSNYAGTKQCRRIDQYGQEVWYSVAANQSCPRG